LIVVGGCDAPLGGRSLLVIDAAFHLRKVACDGGVERAVKEGWGGVIGGESECYYA
jgi:hypothetical protein